MTPIIRKEKLIERLEKELATLKSEYRNCIEWRDWITCDHLSDEIKRKERLIEVQKNKLKELKESK